MAIAANRTKRKAKYVHGSTAPATISELEQLTESLESIGKPLPQGKASAKAATKVKNVQQSAPSVSLFAIIGFFAIAALMIFVMLAQVNLNEVMRETARLNSHLEILGEQRRVLSITFESVIDMDEVERYARDVLGMSTPESEQYTTVIRSFPIDRVEVFDGTESGDGLREFRSFLTFLFEEYIR